MIKSATISLVTGYIKAASIVFTWRNLQESRREHQKKTEKMIVEVPYH